MCIQASASSASDDAVSDDIDDTVSTVTVSMIGI